MLFHETNESDIQLFHSISITIHVKYNCNSGTSKFACMHEIYIYIVNLMSLFVNIIILQLTH